MSMNPNIDAETSTDSTGQFEVLSGKLMQLSAASGAILLIDDESVGFDPYDTASLYIQKSADQK